MRVFGGPTVKFLRRRLGVGVPCGAGLCDRHPIAARILGDIVDANGACHGALGAARPGPRRVPPAQHECDGSVCDSLGRVAVEQHGCDLTITRWLIAMAPMYWPTTRTESPARPSSRWNSAWSSRTPRPDMSERWYASNTAGWNSRTGEAAGSRSRSDPDI